MKNLHVIDLSQDKSKYNPYLGDFLLSNITKTLENKEKVILYLNKRGNYSSYICSSCSYIHSCPKCDLSLYVHKTPERLMCHHCFFECEVYSHCQNCESENLKKVGVGTEQIESSIQELFPNASSYRFDTDQLKNISSKKEALQKLADTDIIIWTKMITTGFNIEKVWCIGIILLEQELSIPRYNNQEQVYSNIRQLIGRGGRKQQTTEIIMQTYTPRNPLILQLSEKNYRDFFIETLSERKAFHYPPYCELAYLVYKHFDKQKSRAFIKSYFEKISQNIPSTIELQLVDTAMKRNNQYFTKIVIKWTNLRGFLSQYKSEILKNKDLSLNFEY